MEQHTFYFTSADGKLVGIAYIVVFPIADLKDFPVCMN